MSYLTSGPAASLWATLLLLLCLLSSARCGSLVLGRIPGIEAVLTGSERRAFSVALGLTLAGLAVLAAGSAGWTGRGASYAILCLLAAAGTAAGRFPLRRSPAAADPRTSAWFVAACAVPLILSWLSALLPPTGTDALSYHLTHPRLFLQQGRIAYLPYSRESMWPYGTEMLFLWGLSLQGTTLATLFHWVYWPLTARLIYLFCSRFAGAASARAAVLVFLYTPALFAQSGQPYVDLALACQVFLITYGLALYWKSGSRAAAVTSGLAAGAALGVKLLALGPAVLGAVFVWLRSGRRLRAVAVYALAAAAVGGVWYARSWRVLGNPVYPFFPGFFGGAGIESDIANTGAGTGFRHFLCLPWNLTLRPSDFGGEMIGPAYLSLGLPGLLRLASAGPIGLALASFGALTAGFIFTQSQLARFFLMLTPLGAAAAGWSFDQTRRLGQPARAAAAVCLAASVLMGAAIFVYRLRDAAPVLAGARTPQAYLLEKDRSFAGHDFLSRSAGPGQTVFNTGEPKYFYDPTGRMVMDNRLFRDALTARGETIEGHLARARYDYLWTSEGADEDTASFAKANGYQPVFAYSFTEKPAEYRHVIYGRTSPGAARENL